MLNCTYFSNKEADSIHKNKGGFLAMQEISRCYTCTKEINHASARTQYVNENIYCKNCLRVFSAITENQPNAEDVLLTNKFLNRSDTPHSSTCGKRSIDDYAKDGGPGEV